MSRKLPFEEAVRHKLNELPLPDEHDSWQHMKALLETKKERRLFAFLKRGKAWIAATLFVCLWLVIAPEKTNHTGDDKAKRIEAISRQDSASNNIETTPGIITDNGKSYNRNDSLGLATTNKNSNASASIIYNNKRKVQQINQALHSQTGFASMPVNRNNIPKTRRIRNQHTDTGLIKESFDAHNQNNNDELSLPGKNDTAAPLVNITNQPVFSQPDMQHDSIARNVNDSTAQAINSITDLSSITKKAKASRHIIYIINAGIGIKQQIPVGGQKLVTYNYAGDKVLLLDYIPLVYIQLQKNRQWFLQGEFSYASPALTRAFAYEQQTKADYIHGSIITTSASLQKAYYSQAPVSFHVYVRPAWSVGAGAMYSWMKGMLINEQVAINNLQSGDQTITDKVMPVKGYTDSFFYKTKTSFLLQTNFEKARWSFSLRYTKDVQPFIRYTMPEGTISTKKAASLDVLVRYRLFQVIRPGKK